MATIGPELVSPRVAAHLSHRWWTIALRGVAAILLGILSLFLPQVTFLSMVILFGVYAIIDGLLSLGLGTGHDAVRRASVAVRAVASIAAGVIALVWPGITALALLFVIASWALIAGALEIAMAMRLRRHLRHESLLVLEGILSIVFGCALFIAPAAGAIALGLWVGAFALVLGILLVSAALQLRKQGARRGGAGDLAHA